MMKIRFIRELPIILFAFMLSCALQKSTKELERKPLFKQVDNSGIDFVNDLTPTLELSAFDYIYFQNGGGVAVADFDQDGFEDVFFTSNLHPDRIYRNLGSLKFEDLTQSASTDGFSGGSLKSWSTGVAICDVNDDGYPDIYICKSGNIKRGRATENLLYINNKDFTFTEKGKEYGLNDANYSTQAVFFDFDLDGDLDAFILNHSPLFGDPELAYQLDKLKNALKPHSNSLYLNDGGHFRNVTSEAGLLAYSKGLGVVASDLDQDGWIDLYVANDFSKPDRLYLNQGDGTFKEGLKGNVGHISQFSMGCDIADMNNDGLLDISVVDMAPANNFRSKTQMPSMSIEDFRTYTEEYDYLHQYMFNSLLLNQGNGKFSEIAKMAGIHKTDWSWSTLLADFDNDGLKDNVVTNGYMFNRMDNDFSLRFDSMMRSYDRNPPLEARRDWIDAPPSYKLANYAWKNMSDLRFQDVSQDWGFSKESFSNGAAYSDVDNDGDLDLIVNNLNDTAFVFENTCTNNFLQLELSTEGRFDLNRFLNSTATLYYDEEIQLVEFTLSKGYQSSTSNILHFGLGQLDTVDSVLIQVPGEEARVIKDVEANQRLILDYSDTRKSSRYKRTKEDGHIFIEQVLQGLEYTHKENDYDDFIKELLLPHRNSRYGPFISKGDVNNDGMEDIYIGGASGQSAALFIQQSSGGFASSNSETWEVDAESEDMKSCFFDVDNDGDLDLYVVSGGNAYYPGDSRYQDRLYLNNGEGLFKKSKAQIPRLKESGSIVVKLDYDDNGTIDLFVGGRMKAQHYPYPSSSFLLNNNGTSLEDVTQERASVFNDLGIVTDAIYADIDSDGSEELIVVGEWMHPRIFSFIDGQFSESTPESLKSETGWWNTIHAYDLDGDGDKDLIGGNLGLNYKYKADLEKPFSIYANDFDKSGNLDIVLSYHSEGKEFPVRGRECSSQQVPMIAEKFPSYKDFGKASLEQVYGTALNEGLQLFATEFASCIFWNAGSGRFVKQALPIEAQLSNVNDILFKDFNKDGFEDLLLVGNMFSSEVETPRNDASYGCLLLGNSNGGYDHLPNRIHGLYESGDIKDIQYITIGMKDYILITNNNDKMSVYTY